MTHGIRVLPYLRASQVADAEATPDVEVLYFEDHYDLGSTPLPARCRRVTLLQACRALRHTRAEFLELPEPLWLRFLPVAAVLVAAWHLGRPRRLRARFYAIENNAAEVILFGRAVPAPTAWATRLLLGAAIRVAFDRIAYGSDGARVNYCRLPMVSSIRSRVFTELPTASTRVIDAEDSSRAMFIGHLHSRKGLTVLMDAWEKVETESPGSRLTIAGAGPLEGAVRRWAASAPISREFLGQVDHAVVPDLLAASRVAVVPSQRDGRWREQIGLPIVEALSVGTTIVTTCETGLAEWLQQHGHLVLGADAGAKELARAIATGLSTPLDREVVLRSLPLSAAREEAARWLIAP